MTKSPIIFVSLGLIATASVRTYTWSGPRGGHGVSLDTLGAPLASAIIPSCVVGVANVSLSTLQGDMLGSVQVFAIRRFSPRAFATSQGHSKLKRWYTHPDSVIIRGLVRARVGSLPKTPAYGSGSEGVVVD